MKNHHKNQVLMLDDDFFSSTKSTALPPDSGGGKAGSLNNFADIAQKCLLTIRCRPIRRSERKIGSKDEWIILLDSLLAKEEWRKYQLLRQLERSFLFCVV